MYGISFGESTKIVRKDWKGSSFSEIVRPRALIALAARLRELKS
jgi:hypothetical protein